MGAMRYLPAVAGVAVVGKYRLRLLFDDGTVGEARRHPLAAAA